MTDRSCEEIILLNVLTGDQARYKLVKKPVKTITPETLEHQVIVVAASSNKPELRRVSGLKFSIVYAMG